jgi:uncharacterized membrane-anchored protein
MYVYTELRPELFTEEGVEKLTQIRRNVERALRDGGAVRAQEATRSVYGDSWLQLAALDYMVEKGEIREITGPDVAAQHRVFVAGRK